MVFAFLFGLSMDYEVFILARMREEYDATGSTDAAVVRGIGRTGRLVTSAALILFLAFASMASAPDTDRQGVRHRAGRGDHPRRHRHPGAARAGGGVAVRALELVAARAPGAAAAGRALAAAARRRRGRPHVADVRDTGSLVALIAHGPLQRRRVGPADPAVDEELGGVDVRRLVGGEEQRRRWRSRRHWRSGPSARAPAGAAAATGSAA